MKQFCVVCILMILTHEQWRCGVPYVFPKGGYPCTPSVQTCLPHITNCGYIKFKPTLTGSAFIQSCISMANCWNYMHSEAATATCCKTDLCNQEQT